MISGANDEELDIANIRADFLLEIKIKEVVEYLKHHVPIIIKYENGTWSNAKINLEGGIMVVTPDYEMPFDN